MSLLLLALAPSLAAELRGVVRERGSREPIEGAWVRVDGAPGAPQTATDRKGWFVLELPEGEWTVEAASADHPPSSVTVIVPAAEPVEIWLKAAPAEDVVVEADRPSPHVARQILDRERVEETPGTYGDPIRLIQSLPGTTQTREFSPGAGDVVLRGAAPGESRFYLDGVEIPYLYHFQQYASVIHTRLLEEVAVYPSTFGPAYGDAVGGVVAAEPRAADTAAVHGGVNASLITSGLYATAPVSAEGAVSVSARRSYADLAQSGNDQYTAWPVFWDYLGRYDQDLGPDHHLSLTAIGAGDHYGRYVSDSATLNPIEQEDNPDFQLNRAFHMVSARSRDLFGVTGITSAVGFVSDRWRGTIGDEGQDRTANTLTLRSELALFQSEHYQLDTGLELELGAVDRQANPSRAWFELEGEAPLLARGAAVHERLRRAAAGVWLEPRIRVGRTTLQPGARAQADSATGTIRVDPRFTMQAALSEAVKLRAAAGRYTQAPELDDLSPTTGDPELPVTSSWSAAAGVEGTIARRLELGVDGWFRSFTDAVVRTPGEAPSSADGYAWGAELTSRYRLRERFFFGAWLSVGHAERGDLPFDYDQPYAASVLGSWDFHEGWNAGLRYRIAAGLPYTPVDSAIYQGDSDTYEPVFGADNSARLPTYQKVDAHLERRWTFTRWTLVGYAELWYVPPRANVLYPAWSYDYSQTALVAGPPFLPLVGMRADL